ncbi:MAG TPA: hypothetical protein VF097_11150 [Actinomycetota bacterium]
MELPPGRREEIHRHEERGCETPLHGIAVALWTQFVESQARLEEGRRRAVRAREEQEAARGRYL